MTLEDYERDIDDGVKRLYSERVGPGAAVRAGSNAEALARRHEQASGTTNMFRWFAVAIVMSAVATSGFYRQRARSAGETIDRRREGGLFLAIRALAAPLLFLPMIAYMAMPRWMIWASFELPAWIRWIGVIVGVLAIPAVSWVLRSLGHNVSETVLTKRDHQLVMSGPYQWVRHPLSRPASLCLWHWV